MLLIQMDKYKPPPTRLFHALGDPPRAAVAARLGEGPATVSELAQPFAMALPAFLKHLRVLEAAGAIATEKHGRTRICRLRPDGFGQAEDWLAQRRLALEAQTVRLQDFLETGLDLSDGPAASGDAT